MYYGVFSDASIFYEKGFIVSNASMFVMHEIIANGQKVQDNIIKYIPGTIIESMALDSNLDIIYFVDGKSNSLKKYNIRSNQLITLISISASTGNIYIFSITRNLLWQFDSTIYHVLGVSNLYSEKCFYNQSIYMTSLLYFKNFLFYTLFVLLYHTL